MSMNVQAQSEPKVVRAASWLISGLVAAFLTVDGALKVMATDSMRALLQKLDVSPGLSRTLGVVILAIALLYIYPRTAILGAVLLTGYLGGALATHLQAGSPPLSFAVSLGLGLLAWGGLYLREPVVRDGMPLRR